MFSTTLQRNVNPTTFSVGTTPELYDGECVCQQLLHTHTRAQLFLTAVHYIHTSGPACRYDQCPKNPHTGFWVMVAFTLVGIAMALCVLLVCIVRDRNRRSSSGGRVDRALASLESLGKAARKRTRRKPRKKKRSAKYVRQRAAGEVD